MSRKLIAIDTLVNIILFFAFLWLYFYANALASTYKGDLRVVALKFATEYLAYAVIAAAAALSYLIATIYGILAVPSYSKGLDIEDILKALVIMSFIYFSIYFYRTLAALTEWEVLRLSPIAVAFISGLKGIAENYLFIGVVGTTIYKYTKNKWLAALIVGLIAALYHGYVILPLIFGIKNIGALSAALFAFLFFFFGTLVTLTTDNIWIWNAVHFFNNFIAKYFMAVQVSK